MKYTYITSSVIDGMNNAREKGESKGLHFLRNVLQFKWTKRKVRLENNLKLKNSWIYLRLAGGGQISAIREMISWTIAHVY